LIVLGLRWFIFFLFFFSSFKNIAHSAWTYVTGSANIYQWLYIFSGIGTAGGLVLLSASQLTVLWQLFLIQGVLLGVAIAFGAQPALVVVGHHFFRRRSLAMGIVAASGSVGGVCFPLIFAQLRPRIGLGWTLRLVALIIL
jgi:uncharacterized membrane protein